VLVAEAPHLADNDPYRLYTLLVPGCQE